MTVKFSEYIQEAAKRFEKRERDLVLRTFLRLWHCGDTIGRYVDLKIAGEFDCDRTMVYILAILLRQKGVVPQKDIAGAVSRTKQATTMALDRLEKKGFIERVSQAGNRRVNMIKITEKGAVCIEATAPTMSEMSSEALSCLTQAETEQLHTILTKLVPDLRTYVEKYVNHTNPATRQRNG